MNLANVVHTRTIELRSSFFDFLRKQLISTVDLNDALQFYVKVSVNCIFFKKE